MSWQHANGGIGSLDVIFSPELVINTHYYAQDDQMEMTGTKGVIWVTKGHGQILDRPTVILYRDGEVRHLPDVDFDWVTASLSQGTILLMHF